MTRLEYLRTASAEEVAELLCHITQVTTDAGISAYMDGKIHNPTDMCECCIATGHCKECHTGFIDWLNREAVPSRVEAGIKVFD